MRWFLAYWTQWSYVFTTDIPGMSWFFSPGQHVENFLALIHSLEGVSYGADSNIHCLSPTFVIWVAFNVPLSLSARWNHCKITDTRCAVSLYNWSLTTDCLRYTSIEIIAYVSRKTTCSILDGSLQKGILFFLWHASWPFLLQKQPYPLTSSISSLPLVSIISYGRGKELQAHEVVWAMF